MNYGAPKLEMFAAFYFIEKFHSYLAARKFTLRVDNQALSWLKTYSMDLAMIGRWISRLDQYDFEVEHRARTKHFNADGLSKRSNSYKKREKLLEANPDRAPGFSFMKQEDYDALPVTPWLNKQGQPIWSHPDLPEEYKAYMPKPPCLSPPKVLTPTEPTHRNPDEHASEGSWFPQVVWDNAPTALRGIF